MSRIEIKDPLGRAKFNYIKTIKTLPNDKANNEKSKKKATKSALTYYMQMISKDGMKIRI